MAPKTFVCPKCCEPSLKPFTYEGIEVDFCDSCKGIWLDAGELARYVELSKDIPNMEESMSSARETDMPCPKCSGFLQEMKYHRDSNVLIDRCPSCRGIFLDAGEISDIEALSAKLENPFRRVYAALQEARRDGYTIL